MKKITKKIKYRVGFDLGYTSIGWAVLELDKNYQVKNFIDFGVRIFPSGRDKSNEPISVIRREKRGMRKNRDRYLTRRNRLLSLMIDLGLQPDNKKARKTLSKKEPLVLRAQGANGKIDLYDVGRALFHINQRRGFKSNRVADRKGSSELKGMLGGVDSLEKILETNGITLGQYLYSRLKKNKNTRFKAGDNQYDCWASRKMYFDEFKQIMKTQQIYYPTLLSDENITKLENEIFFQRKLKPQIPGNCSLIKSKKRIRSAYPESQLFRIYQEVNNLEIIVEDINTPQLTTQHRDDIVNYLTCDFSKLGKNNMLSWAKIQKIIGIKGIKFNLEKLGRKGLKANTTDILLQNNIEAKWNGFSGKHKHILLDILLLSQSNKEFEEEISQFCKLTNVVFLEEEVIKLKKILRLDEGFSRVSLEAIEKILPELKKWKGYSNACKAVGINHSDDRDGEMLQELPYYGKVLPKAVIGGTGDVSDSVEKRYGKINNPTVHMALNQFKIVLNDLMQRFGCAPEEIHIELARETTMSAKQWKEFNFRQKKNKLKNDEINEILEKLQVQQNYNNRMKYKLWEDLDKSIEGRACPLSGKSIGLDVLFKPLIEVEHIIPFSISFDDGRNNKMICYKSANQYKANRTPYEAFSSSADTYNWNDIIARAKRMPLLKFKRFLPDALDWFRDSNDGKYIERMLNDTKYMSKIARKYAESVAPKVITIKGKFTSDLRHEWGLDRLTHNFSDGKWIKDRNNHHHHAIDALVVALTNISTMQKISKANRKANDYGSSRLYLDIEKPYHSFSVKQIQDKLIIMVISHKLDHKNCSRAKQNGTTVGELHEDSNYGHKVENIYAITKPLRVENFQKIKNINEIASPEIRQDVKDILTRHYDLKTKKLAKKAYEIDLNKYKSEKNIKKVRMHFNKPDLIPIYDKNGKPYRYVIGGNNFCAEIYCNQKGEKAGKWQCEVIQNYFANKRGFVPEWRKKNATAFKVMRLQKNDMIAIDNKEKREIYLITAMGVSKQIFVKDHNNMTKKTSFKASSLQKLNARKLFVSPTGKIYDPGCSRKPKR